ncbi:hemolysin III family protein [Flammeovirga yaeyamensis]|uniref:Hemolysin III family protein n=1 Tax=Flammeovirga yaeyamensis TaxID=367791 RepID=A0AAX1N6W4_9BACT|nr:hemolysin III family protein [Flammeovirga yaeyamensis]MBB3697837.1 hemolysin III [Flammeovirga yaeyamensis]NMF35807.1 hemolysin III family protein [Flammeovirga yaeyamensis]QWG03241.1 hemolysin III family protein [Flammeovirga yaeyamensis]
MHIITRDKEEIVNTITHGLGVVLSIVAMVLLLIKADSTTQYVVYSIFGVSMISLYSSSTAYHLIAIEKVKLFLRKLDHSGIFLLIAGTYTPFAFLSLEQSGGLYIGIFVWVIALAGMIYKLFFKIKYAWLSNLMYLAMGWIAVFKLSTLHAELQEGFWFLIAGGVAYSVGVIFYAMKKLPYSHAIWHLFVLLGSAFMFLSVYLFT